MTEITNDVDVDRLNELHKKIEVCTGQTLHMMLEAGAILLNKKEFLPHGTFGDWLEKNCEFSRSTANRYMRCERARQLGTTTIPSGNTILTNMKALESLLREDDAILEERRRKRKKKEKPTATKPPAAEQSEFADFEDEDEEEQLLDPRLRPSERKKLKEAVKARETPAAQPSKKRDTDLLRNALEAIGRALKSVEGDKKAEWAKLIIKEVELYMGPFETGPERGRGKAARSNGAAEKPTKKCKSAPVLSSDDTARMWDEMFGS